jgi:hypothetical protein
MKNWKRLLRSLPREAEGLLRGLPREAEGLLRGQSPGITICDPGASRLVELITNCDEFPETPGPLICPAVGKSVLANLWMCAIMSV